MSGDDKVVGIGDEAAARRLHWALGEALGGERPPDVVAPVLARLAAGDAGPPVRSLSATGTWLGAAVLLLGLAVVALMLGTRRGSTDTSDELQEREYAVVMTMAAIDVLPVDASAVELRGLGQPGLVALARRCAQLTHLRVRGAGLDPFGGAVVREQLAHLRSLDLSGVTGTMDVFVAEALAVPGLQELVLRGVDVRTIAPMLPSAEPLRRVDFGEAPWLDLAVAERMVRAGKRVLAHKTDDPEFARRLAALTERYAYRLDRPFYHRIESLAALRALPRGAAHVELHRLGDAATQLLVLRDEIRGVTYVQDDNDAFSAASLQLLGRMRGLQELRIRMPHWDGSGSRQLAGLPALRLLEIEAGIDAAALAVLPQLPALADLTITGARSVGDDGIRAIAACRSMARLRIAACERLQDAHLAGIGEMPALRQLDLTGQSTCGEATLAAIGRLHQLESLQLGHVQFSAGALAALGGLRSLRMLHLDDSRLSTADLTSLPVSLRNLSLAGCTGLDTSAGSLLRDRFPQLASIDVSRCAWLDDEALQAIFAAPFLERLTVTDCPGPTDRCLPALRAAPRLVYLDAARSPFLDDEIASALRNERPDLRLGPDE